MDGWMRGWMDELGMRKKRRSMQNRRTRKRMKLDSWMMKRINAWRENEIKKIQMGKKGEEENKREKIGRKKKVEEGRKGRDEG